MSDLLQEGFALMALGMGTVFGFLILLIFGTSLMSVLIRRFSQPETLAPANNGRRGRAQMDQIAAVAAAARAAHNR